MAGTAGRGRPPELPKDRPPTGPQKTRKSRETKNTQGIHRKKQRRRQEKNKKSHVFSCFSCRRLCFSCKSLGCSCFSRLSAGKWEGRPAGPGHPSYPMIGHPRAHRKPGKAGKPRTPKGLPTTHDFNQAYIEFRFKPYLQRPILFLFSG